MKFVSDCCGLFIGFSSVTVCAHDETKLRKNQNMLRKTHCAMNTLYLDILMKSFTLSNASEKAKLSKMALG